MTFNELTENLDGAYHANKDYTIKDEDLFYLYAVIGKKIQQRFFEVKQSYSDLIKAADHVKKVTDIMMGETPF